MSMTFKNSVFSINGHNIFAYQASMEEKVEIQRVDIMGVSQAGTNGIDLAQGAFSADFYLTSADWAYLKAAFDSSKNGEVYGGPMGAVFENGYITDLSISAEPLSLLKGSIKGGFAGNILREGSGSAFFDVAQIAHGAFSSVSINPDLFSVEISYSQSIEPNYGIGGEIINYKYGGGEVRCSVEGKGLQDAVDACSDNTVSVTLKNSCDLGLGSISVSGLKISDSSITINESEDVVGKMELIKYF